MRTLRPSVQPRSCSPCPIAAISDRATGSVSANTTSTPMRRITCGCCARAASGHPAATPPPAIASFRAVAYRLSARTRPAHRWPAPAAGLLAFSRLAQGRSEEHTSELQSLRHLVCRLLLEKKKKKIKPPLLSKKKKTTQKKTKY